MELKNVEFDVALSFAGEDRKYVAEVAETLSQMDIKVFYDKYETISLWGKNLYEHLQEIYYSKSRYVVMFLSENYAKKLWTNHERKSAQAKAFESHQEYILPARFDNTEIPGILPTIAYINLKDYSPQEFAKLIKEKIGPLQRFEFIPKDLDLLYELLGSTSEQDEIEIGLFAYAFFDSLKLMTSDERIILFTAIYNACPAGLPDNIHLNIELLSRLVGSSIEEIESIFAHLDSLGYVSRVYKENNHKDNLCKAKNIIEIEYQPLLTDTDIDNGTCVMAAIVEILTSKFCLECSKNAFERIDFSILSSLTGYPEKL
jgi:hypothetical protein